MPLHDYQQTGHAKAVAALRAGLKKGYSAPTGSGKSFIQAANHDALGSDLLTVVPSTEIGLGIYKRLEKALFREDIFTFSEARQQVVLEAAGIWTVMRLYNELVAGRINPPKYLQFDEGHHTTADTYESVHAFCGDCPAVMYTATAYRGTPEESAKLLGKWGEIEPLITLKECVRRGFVSRPDFIVWPLMNDEEIKIKGGEFETKVVESKLDNILDDLVARIVDQFCIPREYWCEPSRPTMVTAPGVASAASIGGALAKAGVPAVVVTGAQCVYIPASESDGITRGLSRQEAFKAVVECKAILVQVNVVSEGVDLPIRVHIDTAPCMSPVRWMQRVGRGTRPVAEGEDPPVYVCTNHNLSRHAYLWAGLIPMPRIRDAQQAWGEKFEPSRRMFARAIGLEGFGKFLPAKIPMADGTYAGLYALQTKNGTHQYAVFLHPAIPSPLYFERENPYTGETETKTIWRDGKSIEVTYKKKDYGPWKVISKIPDADGYVSVKPQPITPNMLEWWQKPKPQRGAEWAGLDPTHVPNAKEFTILPILCNTGARFKIEE